MSSSGNTQAIQVLHKCRKQLLELQKTEPGLDNDNIADYRDDISQEIGIATKMEFTSRLNERRQAQIDEHDSKRTDIENEVYEYQTQIANADKVHQANMKALSNGVLHLEQQLSNMSSSNATELSSLESTLTKLREDQAANSVVLAELEERMAAEKEEERLEQAKADKRLLEINEKKAFEEKEHFAALWIQLRWKAYLKRKALKQSKKKGGKKKKEKKAKK